MKALTSIKHGDKEGNVKTFDVGEEVTGLSDEEMDELKAAGSVGEYHDPADTNEELERLRAQVAQLEAETRPTRAPTPGEAVEEALLRANPDVSKEDLSGLTDTGSNDVEYDEDGNPIVNPNE